jgi:hypothetical protein
MNSLETVIVELEAVERQLSRRGFLKLAAFVAAVPTTNLTTDNATFLRAVSATVLPSPALHDSGIDVVANFERLLRGTRHEHRVKLLRLVTCARRICFVYGGEQFAVSHEGRNSFSYASWVRHRRCCLVTFWGDLRSLRYVDASGEHP